MWGWGGGGGGIFEIMGEIFIWAIILSSEILMVKGHAAHIHFTHIT